MPAFAGMTNGRGGNFYSTNSEFCRLKTEDQSVVLLLSIRCLIETRDLCFDARRRPAGLPLALGGLKSYA